MAEQAWEETIYELNKRIQIMIGKQIFSQTVGHDLLENAIELAELRVSLMPHKIYASYQTEAIRRIPRDPNDWFTVALALTLGADIWTLDRDFFGCGIAIWTTETLLSYLGKMNAITF